MKIEQVSSFMRSALMSGFLVLLMLAFNGAGAQELRVQLTDAEGNPLADAVIELVLPDDLKPGFQMAAATMVDQRDKEFVPSVSAVPVGSKINFPNSDDILHHVYSFSPAKTFNIPLYGQGENDSYIETFDIPGVVEIGCNIHDWMLAYIYVAETTLFAISGEDGAAELTDLPAGEFSLRVWHPRAAASIEELTQTVALDSAATTSLTLSLELQRERRVRRAPGANSRRYR